MRGSALAQLGGAIAPASAADGPPPAPAPAVLAPIDVTSASGPSPTPDGVQAEIGRMARRGLFDGSIIVVDPTTKTVLLDQTADRPRIPASVTKLATSTAALTVLGPQTRLPTIVYREGDTIYLVGGGDPTLVRTGGGNPLAGGSASMRDLAEATAAK
ncbi:MAG: D-alanyl-D-alanine carboxypeptidase, partial [Actinobacteria bacterium]|nr:D-alanyl-D-alanine carboxypeptidase [Actinomycetota bacterium]